MPVPSDWPAVDRDRSRQLLDVFRRRSGASAAVLVSAPGRVNLLGEHTDYNGLPVLPMAIDRSILMAAAPRRDGAIVVENMDPAFPPRAYEIAESIPAFADGDWGNYHKAAVQGVLRHSALAAQWHGGTFVVDGNIPAGAGLSSSSAFVVASALAFLAVNQMRLDPVELAEMLPVAERYVGTLSGGMDQATSLLARAGHALRIDFFPLRVRPVRLPPDLAVVVCHSLVRAEKSAGAREAYNRRVVECRIACRALERALGGQLPRRLRTFGDLAEIYPDRLLRSFLAPLEDRLPEGALPLREIADRLDLDIGELRRDCGVPPAMADEFAVLRRARHVLTEGDRVNEGERSLNAGAVEDFGRLMFASHASCRDDYEVSCAALDELVEVAAAAGALGARLTGAGFGGCTVNLVRSGDLARFQTEIDRGFYAGHLSAGDDPRNHRFALTARGGAKVAAL